MEFPTIHGRDFSNLAVAYGGGVNSTAMLIEFKKRGIIPSLILFADTGGETPQTYQCIKAVSDWCKSVGFPEIVTVFSTFKGEPQTLEQNCLRLKMLPSIAYGYKTCSQKHKIQPQDKFCNNFDQFKQAWKIGKRVLKAIGYDAGESRRAKISNDDKYDYFYPLVEWSIYREDCVRTCKQEGFDVPKSSCFFCPSMKPSEILRLRDTNKDLFDRAVAMEKNAETTTVKGLGRDFAWGDMVENFDKYNLLDKQYPPDAPCGCYDG